MTKYIRDYYKILRIKKTANQKTIKKAYKRAIKKYHPDVNKNKNAENKFLLIEEAYSVLSNERKKETYDKLYTKAKNKDKTTSNINIKDTVNMIQKINDNTGILSKGIKIFSKSMKSQPLMTGSKLLLGSAVAGYGIKRGRNFMKGRMNK